MKQKQFSFKTLGNIGPCKSSSSEEHRMGCVLRMKRGMNPQRKLTVCGTLPNNVVCFICELVTAVKAPLASSVVSGLVKNGDYLSSGAW